jgi:putative transcriptional regulator
MCDSLRIPPCFRRAGLIVCIYTQTPGAAMQHTTIAPYTPIAIDREALTIMGVSFPDLATLESAADAIGSQMFEGFTPTKRLVEFYRDWRAGKISENEFLPALRAIYEK